MRNLRTAFVLLAVATLMTVLAAPALAGKPTRYELTVPDGYFGETVTATAASGGVVTAASSDDAADYTYWRVLAQCYQQGELVFKHYALFDGAYSLLPLGPTRSWQEGSAECTAELGYFHKGSVTRWRVVDSTTFAALWTAPTNSSESDSGGTVSAADDPLASAASDDGTTEEIVDPAAESTATASFGGSLFFAI